MKFVAIMSALLLAGISLAVGKPDATQPSDEPRDFPIVRHSDPKKIIYIFDGSKAAAGAKGRACVEEAKKSVSRLSVAQSFNVLIYEKTDDGKSFVSFKEGSAVANPKNKQQFFDLMDNLKFESDSADPIPALEEAFKEKPRMIYLLADQPFAKPDEVANRIKALNPEKEIKVNTILLLNNKSETEKFKDFADTLKQIAVDSGGIYVPGYADELDPATEPSTQPAP